jgi:hypothetical protein
MRGLQLLCLYAAAAISAFGWVVVSWCELKPGAFWLQWLAGALFIYNLDRIRVDPADAINVPQRAAGVQEYRAISLAVIALSALALPVIPLLERNWPLFAMTIGGAVICAGYSLPIFGQRIKSLPVIKTLFIPTLLTGAYFAPVSLEARVLPDLRLVGWVWGLLLFNVLLFDLRDLAGDRKMRTATIPVLIGRRRTFFLLIGLQIIVCLLSSRVEQWITDLVFAGLLVAATRKRGEAFYEWLVDGALFVPALVELGKHLLR